MKDETRFLGYEIARVNIFVPKIWKKDLKRNSWLVILNLIWDRNAVKLEYLSISWSIKWQLSHHKGVIQISIGFPNSLTSYLCTCSATFSAWAFKPHLFTLCSSILLVSFLQYRGSKWSFSRNKFRSQWMLWHKIQIHFFSVDPSISLFSLLDYAT